MDINYRKKRIKLQKMEPYTGNSASAAGGTKKDKKSKKNYDDGEGKKKFVSIDMLKLAKPFYAVVVPGP